MMRLKPGRPNLGAYSQLFTVPAAEPDSPLTTAWLGVATVLVDDGQSALLTDGFFSRPSLAEVGLRRLSPSQSRVDGCLYRAGINKLAAVIPVHTHYDHALDSAVVAQRSDATLIGGASAANIARGHGLPENRIVVAQSGTTIAVGNYDITLVESEHCPPDRYPGAIDKPVPLTAKVSAYRCGETWSTLIAHRPTGTTLLIQGSAGYVRGALDGRRADVAYLGVGQLGVMPQHYIEEYWRETVSAVGARSVVLIHWDDFFRPLSKPLRTLPYAVDDLDVTVRVLAELAAADGVALHLPTLWQRADPWR